MAAIKIHCPSCDASIRHNVTPADAGGEVSVTCPRCGVEFFAPVDAVAPPEPKKAAAQKSNPNPKPATRPAKALARGADDEDGPKPKKKKKKPQEAAGPNKQLITAAVVGGVLLVGGVVAAVVALGGKDKDKNKDVAKNDPPAQVEPQPQPRPQPQPEPRPNAGRPNAGRPNAGRPNAGTGTPIPTVPTPTPNPLPKPPDPGFGSPFKLPDPPVVRIDGSVAPTGKPIDPVEKPPPSPPLTADEDPFERFKKFRPDGPLPKLPRLPPVGQRPLLTLDAGGHSAFVGNVFVSADGKRVITAGQDKAVRVWEVQTGAAVRTVHLPAGLGDAGALRAAALSPNGKTLAVGGIPSATLAAGQVPVFLIDIEKGGMARNSITTAANHVEALDFSPDGKRLAVGCADGSVQLFDTNTMHGVGKPILAHARGTREVRYSPDGRMLAALGGDGMVSVWTPAPAGLTKIGSLDVSAVLPKAIAWSTDGKLLAVGGDTGEIKLYETNARLARTLAVKPKDAAGRPIQVFGLRFLPGDKELAACGIGGPTIGWGGVVNAETGAVRVEFTQHTNVVWAVTTTADGRRVVTSGGNENEVYVWSADDGKAVSRLSGAGKGIWGVGWARDGKSVAWGTDNTRDAEGNRPLGGVFRLDELNLSGRFAESDYQQALTAEPKTDEKFEVEQLGPNELGIASRGRTPVKVTFPGDKVFAVTLLPGRGLVVAGTAGGATLVDARTGQKVREFTGHAGNVTAVAPSPDGKYFVTGSSDQTMRVWMPEFEEPVLSVFVAKREWIAWTAGGFYACSPQGEQLVAWQVNTTPYKAPAVHPAARFRPSLYQPALIKYLVPTGSMTTAMAMAKKYDRALVETHSVADVMPPEVTLPDLTDDTLVIDRETVVVKATAKGKQPVTAMRLLVDGRPFQGAAGVKKFDKPQAAAEASWEVPLLQGAHSVAVVADTAVSKGMSRVAVITRAGTPPKPNLYVLSVGVSAYPAAVGPLRFAASDAKWLARTFEAKCTGVFANIEVKVLTDADATKPKMRDGLDWLKGKMTAKDVGIVVFSGHGTRDPQGRFYLCTADISPLDPFGTCFGGDEFRRRLEDMPGRLVAILDACHSGAVAEKNAAPPQADGLIRDLVSEDAGVIVLCSSLGREYSIESPLTKAGFYTLGLVEGLSGHGDVDQDGVVYIHELDMYASARVAQLSGGSQTPTMGRPPSIRPFPLAVAPKKK